MSTHRPHLVAAVLAIAVGLAAAGCGGGDDNSTSSAPASSAPAATAPTDTSAGTSTAQGGSSASADGKAIFTSNCAGCHTLADAGSKGNTGPNLDELKPDEATVKNQVINGGGPMPAFGKQGILTDAQIEAVAKYVSSVAGQ